MKFGLRSILQGKNKSLRAEAKAGEARLYPDQERDQLTVLPNRLRENKEKKGQEALCAFNHLARRFSDV